ncbi:hypothetical protein BJ508DRAFT_331925 [Ascobolus immersus RN42]|uniref:Uncharacterized protein n=1 Tax=Ascobolus immersus RN42 TaxID=1160509 RepID=A0A3N4HQM6_ASCIM|nr:hypothetical protein BJ508DRAFT_331925 [Ascobolus immersus RN42]
MSASYPSPFHLSLIVDGFGTKEPCHWSLALHPPRSETCTLLQVLPDPDLLPRKSYTYSRRENVKIFHRPDTPLPSQGRILLAKLSTRQYRQLIHIIQKEPAPKNEGNGKEETCQDWCVNACINLEVDEFVEPGTSEWVYTLMGKSASEMRREAMKRGALKGGTVVWFDAVDEKGRARSMC